MGVPLFVFCVARYAISCCRLENIWSVRPFAFTTPFVVVNPAVRFMIEVQYPLAGAAPVRLVAKSGVVSGKLFDGVGDTDA